MDKRLNRFSLMVGEEKVTSLKIKTVLICGLGGVGGTCLESLARSGVGSFIIVDFDRVDISNLNRQILFDNADVGEMKVIAAQARIKQINEDINVSIYSSRVDDLLLKDLGRYDIDFVIDAIDTPLAKQMLINYCFAQKIPFICSLGMANRLDPTAVRVGSLDETRLDPLAKKMRALLRKDKIDLSKVPVVYSLEKPISSGRTLGSVMNVPSAAGLALSYFCLEYLLK